jgi:hypothetical protein
MTSLQKCGTQSRKERKEQQVNGESVVSLRAIPGFLQWTHEWQEAPDLRYARHVVWRGF